MLSATDGRSTYIEPFVGAGSVAVQMVPHFEHAYLSDASPDLIELWRALKLNWAPPETVSEEEYAALRCAPVSALRGFVGYGCSFGGKWFGGYAHHHLSCCGNPDKTYAMHSSGSLRKKMKGLACADFYCLEYQDTLIPHGSVVYLDPPYAGTTGYNRVGAFDSEAMWAWAEKVSADSTVFVSEYSAPEGWQAAWEGAPQASLGLRDQTGRATEHLWVRCRLQVPTWHTTRKVTA